MPEKCSSCGNPIQFVFENQLGDSDHFGGHWRHMDCNPRHPAYPSTRPPRPTFIQQVPTELGYYWVKRPGDILRMVYFDLAFCMFVGSETHQRPEASWEFSPRIEEPRCEAGA